jgi:hypothetical protein
MDYRTDYINIINEVSEEIASLAFEFMGKTHQSAALQVKLSMLQEALPQYVMELKKETTIIWLGM